MKGFTFLVFGLFQSFPYTWYFLHFWLIVNALFGFVAAKVKSKRGKGKENIERTLTRCVLSSLEAIN